MMVQNRVGTSREVLPEWGVVWQTKGFAPAMGYPHPLRHNGAASFM